ncbi:hypothetical protein A2853_01640 [Candidatus Kaiserbacteria bacterium RIFCSPHIGHO2_01_FULL_55_17]|uniref:Uncharacterized protein n=1 Tax=Candidatus Kaiserbacteria bacterium RIFCSPHIGHO2_01_FULL_55_17 TaxID=1798484 RepID=A0A1F6D982_9BACT|nr:MAG: hypothetical protein A2853_01640 [Candidatus Kaiserbacteria bacterium RIFCSPHIGHO2_01_FULL_55_17]
MSMEQAYRMRAAHEEAAKKEGLRHPFLVRNWNLGRTTERYSKSYRMNMSTICSLIDSYTIVTLTRRKKLLMHWQIGPSLPPNTRNSSKRHVLNITGAELKCRKFKKCLMRNI